MSVKLQDINFELIDKNLDKHRHKSLCWIIQSVLNSLLDLGLICNFYQYRQTGRVYFTVRSDEYVDIISIIKTLISIGSIVIRGNYVTIKLICQSNRPVYIDTEYYL